MGGDKEEGRIGKRERKVEVGREREMKVKFGKRERMVKLVRERKEGKTGMRNRGR